MTVLPYNTDAETVFSLHPDGVLLSNGPGNPNDIPEVVSTIQEIQGKIPIFGICLGHQVFCLANGAEAVKMKYGHRGSNHPVREIKSGRIDFTSQNHGYAVTIESIDNDKLEITHIEINDNTVEGVCHKKFPAFTVQFHPDAAPGPEDANYLFDAFMELMDSWKEQS